MSVLTTHTGRSGFSAEEPGGLSLLDFVRSSGLQSLVVGASKDPNAKITVLLISPITGRAVLAVKAPTTDLAARAVRIESRALLDVRAMLPERLRETIPEVVDLVDFEGRPAVVVSAVPGTPMTTSYYRWRHTSSPVRVGADFAAIATWLADLQGATAEAPAPLDMDSGVSDGLARRFADDPQLDADLERLADVHARLGRDATPRTAVHGDLWFGNVLVADERVCGVVDWEAGSPSGEPVRDLVRFAHMYALYLDRNTREGREVKGHPGLRAGGFGAGLVFALSGSGWFPELFRHFLQHGLARLGASPDNWRDAVLAGLAEVAAHTDDHGFARRHLELFRQVTTGTGAVLS